MGLISRADRALALVVWPNPRPKAYATYLLGNSDLVSLDSRGRPSYKDTCFILLCSEGTSHEGAEGFQRVAGVQAKSAQSGLQQHPET